MTSRITTADRKHSACIAGAAIYKLQVCTMRTWDCKCLMNDSASADYRTLVAVAIARLLQVSTKLLIATMQPHLCQSHNPTGEQASCMSGAYRQTQQQIQGVGARLVPVLPGAMHTGICCMQISLKSRHERVQHTLTYQEARQHNCC
jgi:hypothetical protein